VHSRWQRVVDFTNEINVPVSIGVIAQTIETGGQTYINWIKKQQKTGNVEFWNHGYNHTRKTQNGKQISEFKNITCQEQIRNLEKSQNLAKNRLGFEFVTFGAPYNQTDSNTIKALNKFTEIQYWFYPPEYAKNKTQKLCFSRISVLNIEYPVHHPAFYHLWNNLYFYRNEKYIVLQGHPQSWDDVGFSEFKRMVAYLKRQGYTFKNPQQIHY